MKLFNTQIAIIACILLAAVGCRPRGVLSNREMRNVLYDLHRVDGALQVAGYNYSHDQEVAAYYKNVLDKHGITQAQFDSSLVWYTDNPQIFNKIYPKVIDRLDADYEREKAIREAKRDRRLADKKKTKMSLKAARKEIAEKMELYRNGYPNPWKEWKPEEFCEKNIIIFGQVSVQEMPSH